MANQSPTDDYFDGYRQGRDDALNDVRDWTAKAAIVCSALLLLGFSLLL